MNKKIYLYDTNKDNIFLYESEAVIDPLELELNNKINYLNPPNSTFVEPLESKQGFNIHFNIDKNEWEYKENIEKENKKENIEENEFMKLSVEKQKILFDISDLQEYLAKTDWYVTRKLETGKEIPEDILNKRKEVRDEISNLLEENNDLKKFINK